MKHYRFLNLLVVVIVLLGAFASPMTVAAGNGDNNSENGQKNGQQTFRLEVKWAVPDEYGRHWTYSSIVSDPTDIYGLTTYLRWFTVSSDWEIGPSGFNSTFGADNSIYDARGFHVSLPNGGFTGTHWYQGQCVDGPIVEIEQSPNGKATVINTSGMTLFLYYSEMDKPIELAPGETWRHPVKDDGSIKLQIVADEASWFTCADLVWRDF